MVTEILSPLLSEHGIPLDGAQLSSLEKYAELLCEWNEKMNLTAITDPEGIAVKHFLDSLAFLKKVDVPVGARLADVGTGAGFPGLVLKIARPDIDLVLIDSLQKRLTFLAAVLSELGLSASLVHARAEDAGHDKALRESFDIVTARAVANLSTLSEYCLPLVKVGGVFVPMKTADVESEAAAAEKAVAVLGGKIVSTQIYELPVAGKRSVVTIEKVEHTPPKYPRQRVKITEKPI
jgi:16S rRNA (guanine(527)-N(7))-methyltransferase RsmG